MKSKKITYAVAVLFVISMILTNFSLFSFPLGVSAADEAVKPKATINFADETIELTGIDRDSPVKYMYSPNVSPGLDPQNSSDAKKLAAEKWYPVYGDAIDISKAIPRSGEVMYAFRNADELPDENGVYSSRVTSGVIKARPVISQSSLKTYVKYNAKNEIVEIPDFLINHGGYDYKVGIGTWVTGKTDSSIDASSKYNALGGTIIIRKSATSSEFASPEYKLKIPKAPAAPKIKVNKNKLTGISVKDHKWSTAEDGDYKEFTNSTIELDKLEQMMGISETEANGDYIELYVKTQATDKKPSSQVQRIRIAKKDIK